MNHQLPETGFVRLHQIVGRKEVTPAQAKENRANKKSPKTPREGIPAVIPVCKSKWWQGVKSGRYPQPTKLGPRVTAWRVEDIRALIEQGE